MILALLVDDEPSLCTVAKQFLEESHEMTVDTVFSAQEALQSLGQKAYDVIVSDYQMPGMDGIQLLKSLRSTGVLIPFILFTGKGREEVVIEALNNGADSYLQKGGNVIAQFAELGNAIKQVVKKKRAEDSLRSNEEKFRLITDNMRDTLWLMDMQMRTTWIAPSVFRTRGYTLEELANMPLDQHLTPQSLQKAMLAMSTLLTPENLMDPEKEIAFADEMEYYRKDGTTFWADTVITLLRDELGQPTGFVAVGRDITERKRAEEALRQSEKSYRLVVESAAEVILVLQDGMIRLVNSMAVAMTGFSEQEIMSKPFPSFIHPDDRAMVVERHQRRLRGEAVPARYAFRLLAKDGSIKWVEISAVVVEWEGRPATLNFLTDITERMRVEEALQASERTLADIIDFLPDATFVIDLEGVVVAWNQAIEKMSGVNKEDVIGQGDHAYSVPFYGTRRGMLLDLLTLDDEKIKQKYDYVTRKGNTLYAETFCSVLNEGKGAHVWATATSIFDNQGNRVGAIESIRDIAERKRAEEALIEREKYLRTILRTTVDGFWMLDAEGNVTDVNETYCRMSGYTKDELLGLSIPDLDAVEKRAETAARVNRIIENGSEIFETRHRRKNGSVFDVEVSVTYMATDGGRLVCFCRDITERMHAKREREVLYAIGEAINTNAGLEEILQTIHHNIKKVMYAENCYIALYDAGTGTLSFPLFVDQIDPTPAPRINRRGFTEYVLRTARPLLLTPELFDELAREHDVEIIGTPPESWLGVPLSIQSKPIGILVVQSYEPGRKYTDREKDMLVAIGDQAARVIERKRAEDALREANRKLNLLTNITRHDILNQIMSMRGYLELANDSRDPLKANELRKKALGATRNIESMIEFTKDYQEIGVRESAWHNIRAEVDTLDPNLTSLGFWLENQLPEVEIFADPMLVKVLQSIADNSARHGVHATLMRFSSETEGEALKIICEDDGVGVSVDEKGKIFERGYGKHTGLGLHFAREVLHITRIDIEENGEPGKGARFVISVPKGRWRYAGEEKKIAGVRNKKLT